MTRLTVGTFVSAAKNIYIVYILFYLCILLVDSTIHDTAEIIVFFTELFEVKCRRGSGNNFFSVSSLPVVQCTSTAHSRYTDQLYSDRSRYTDQFGFHSDWSVYREGTVLVLRTTVRITGTCRNTEFRNKKLCLACQLDISAVAKATTRVLSMQLREAISMVPISTRNRGINNYISVV